MEHIRAFIAIELNSAIQAALRQAETPLKNSRVGHMARWVSPTSIHLTLKFLGNMSVAQVPDIGRALQRTGTAYSPFTIGLSGLGCFPHPRRPRVIWVGLGGDLEALASLQESVDRQLKCLGFKPEKRGFTPHLTLGRIRDRARPGERQALVERMSTVRVDTSASMVVREVSLIRSDLRPTGAVYTRLASAPLVKGLRA